MPVKKVLQDRLPYAMVVAAVCLTGYFLIGIFQAAGLEGLSLLALPVCIVLLIGILLAVRKKNGAGRDLTGQKKEPEICICHIV